MIYNYDLSNPIQQCDIFSNIDFHCSSGNEHFAVILNPTSDLILQESRNKPKAKYLKFAGIVKIDDILNYITSQCKITKEQRSGNEPIDKITFSDFKNLLKDFIRGEIFPRYYYLPPLNSFFSHSMIDFQLLEIKKYNKKLFENLIGKRTAGINSSWKEQIAGRYSTYSSRIGVPDISDRIITSILKDFGFDFSLKI